MHAPVLRFESSAEYERFMGRWTRSVARVFLDWLAARPGLRWMDVGCGTGILAETALHLCGPGSVDAIDVGLAQVAAATRGPAGARVRFAIGDARQLAHADAMFDVVASALVINFVSDRALAMAEMRRVGHTLRRTCGILPRSFRRAVPCARRCAASAPWHPRFLARRPRRSRPAVALRGHRTFRHRNAHERSSAAAAVAWARGRLSSSIENPVGAHRV